MLELSNFVGGALGASPRGGGSTYTSRRSARSTHARRDRTPRDVAAAVAAAQGAFPGWRDLPASRARGLAQPAGRSDRTRSRDLRARRIAATPASHSSSRARSTSRAPSPTCASSRARRRSSRARRTLMEVGRNQLHPAPAARRGRGHLSLEPAALSADVEDRSGARRRQLRDRQAFGSDAAHRCICSPSAASRRDCPPGVLNILHGPGSEVGQAIVAHPQVRAISFTGGTATGEHIAASAAGAVQEARARARRQEPHPGVRATATSSVAVDGAVRAAFTNQGEICLCGSRVLIERAHLHALSRGVRRARRAPARRRPDGDRHRPGRHRVRGASHKVLGAVAQRTRRRRADPRAAANAGPWQARCRDGLVHASPP